MDFAFLLCIYVTFINSIDVILLGFNFKLM